MVTIIKERQNQDLIIEKDIVIINCNLTDKVIKNCNNKRTCNKNILKCKMDNITCKTVFNKMRKHCNNNNNKVN